MSRIEIKEEYGQDDPDWFVATCSSGLLLINESTHWYSPDSKLKDPVELLMAIVEYLHRHGEAVGGNNHVDFVRLRQRSSPPSSS